MKKLTGAEKQMKQAYLKKLREGAVDNADPISNLTSLACEGGDQSLQKAAITGLSKHVSDSRAMLGLAMRLFDSWGCNTIGHIIRILIKLRDQGGLILLSSTLFWDNRFIYDKVIAIKKVLKKSGDEQDLLKMEELEKAGNFFVEPKLANEWMKVLIEMKDSDIREGAIFGSEFRGIVGWQGTVLERFSLAEVSNAEKYINSRIPGLVDLYNGKMRRKADLNAT